MHIHALHSTRTFSCVISAVFELNFLKPTLVSFDNYYHPSVCMAVSQLNRQITFIIAEAPSNPLLKLPFKNKTVGAWCTWNIVHVYEQIEQYSLCLYSETQRKPKPSYQVPFIKLLDRFQLITENLNQIWQGIRKLQLIEQFNNRGRQSNSPWKLWTTVQ